MEKWKYEIKKYILKIIIRKWKEKKRVTWMLTWLNVSAAALNVTFQLLVIYRLANEIYFKGNPS